VKKIGSREVELQTFKTYSIGFVIDGRVVIVARAEPIEIVEALLISPCR
jgi:hypothetical protein